MEKLVVELDGQHHGDQLAYDEFRTRQLEILGYRVLRFSNPEIFQNMEGVLIQIREALPTPNPSRRREGDS